MRIPSLLKADLYPYYPRPRVWARFSRTWRGRIRGMYGRLFWLGFAISFDGVGHFHNGRRWWIFFRYRPEFEEALLP